MRSSSYGRLAGGVLVAALVVTTAGPATADPQPTTDYRMLTGVGSDTTQDVMNGLGEAITIGGNRVVASWNATGSAGIKTKTTGCQFTRPNGSIPGQSALLSALTPGSAIERCVDFARSTEPLVGPPISLTRIPYGVDAVTFVTSQYSDLPLTFTLAQLRNVYKCVVSEIAGVPVQPLLLAPGSGTRQYWNQQMGINDAEIAWGDYPCLTPPSQGGTGLAPVQPNDGRVLTGSGFDWPQIMPFSVAQYLGQSRNLPGVEDRRGTAILGQVGSVSPTTAAGTLNPNFPLRREIRNLVPTANLNNALVSQVFLGPGSAICQRPDIIEQYGFLTHPNCGIPL